MEKDKLIILGGNVKDNIKWLKKTNRVYSKSYDVINIYYDHWKNNSPINFDVELNKLGEITNNLDNYYILAKSIGSVLSLIAIGKKIIKPKGIVILGFPLRYLEKNNINIDEIVKTAAMKAKILVIQQKNDPIGSYDEIAKILPDEIETIKIPGCHHVYGKIDFIKGMFDNFIKRLK